MVVPFNDRLKEARLSSGLTQEQLANEIGVAKSTVTGYEKGNSEPNMVTVQRIMETLNVDANFLWQDEMKNTTQLVISMSEKELLKKYRSLEALDKKAVDGLINTLSEREKPIIKERSQDAEHSKEFIVLEPPKIIPCYPKLASAGTGEYLFNDIPVDMIETENNEADFALGVNGNSMEPKFNDGDYVLVKKQSTVNLNDIAIYIIDGECLIKQYKGNRLHSLNPEFNDVMFNKNQNIKCVGKVLGKV